VSSTSSTLLAHDEPGQDEAAWPADVATFLDVIGLYLITIPEKARGELIHDVTRQIFERRL